MQSLKQEYATLYAENRKRYPEYKQAREKMIELLTAKNKVERIWGITEKEKNRDRQQGGTVWYTEQTTMSDGAMSLDGESGPSGSDAEAAVSDIRLLVFDISGDCTQQMADSISQAADAYDVSITPSFRFTKNSDTIDGLSILWVERAAVAGDGNSVEKDILKGGKILHLRPK